MYIQWAGWNDSLQYNYMEFGNGKKKVTEPIEYSCVHDGSRIMHTQQFLIFPSLKMYCKQKSLSVWLTTYKLMIYRYTVVTSRVHNIIYIMYSWLHVYAIHSQLEMSYLYYIHVQYKWAYMCDTKNFNKVCS